MTKALAVAALVLGGALVAIAPAAARAQYPPMCDTNFDLCSDDCEWTYADESEAEWDCQFDCIGMFFDCVFAS